MKKQHRFSIWYAVIGMWAVLFLHNMIASSLTVTNIPYSEFVKAVKEGKVSEIAISENEIQGRMVDSGDGASSNSLFRTIRVDPEISQLMDENSVKYSGRLENNFLGTLLSWLIPIGIFFGIWVLMMRRFQQQSGFMTIGKNKAKIYVDDEVSVRFDDAAGVDEAKQELEEIINFLQ